MLKIKDNKIIKDLKERNEKLVNQYRDRDIRCVSLERQLDELKEENQSLRKQLDYLRSGEYLNQLKFEVSMLEDLVDNNEVSEEDKRFIDMTHRNTELLEENQKYKDVFDKVEEYIKKKINSCTAEANSTTNDTMCRITIIGLKHLLDILKEVE